MWALVDFEVGDVVVLKGLKATELNGQRGVILQAGKGVAERFPVKLHNSGKKLSMKRENMSKTEEADATSDDSMPLLDYFGEDFH